MEQQPKCAFRSTNTVVRVGRGLVNFLQETQTKLSQWYAACVIHHALNTFRSEMLRTLTCHNIISSISQASYHDGHVERCWWCQQPTVRSILQAKINISAAVSRRHVARHSCSHFAHD